MDPLPSLNKIYSMILKVEKQKVNTVLNSDNVEITALLAKSHIFGNKGGYVGRDSSQFRKEQHAKIVGRGRGNHIRNENMRTTTV